MLCVSGALICLRHSTSDNFKTNKVLNTKKPSLTQNREKELKEHIIDEHSGGKKNKTLMHI